MTTARDPGGQLVRVRLDDRGLAGVLAEADGALAIYRDFPAAVEAFDSAVIAPARAARGRGVLGRRRRARAVLLGGPRRGRRVP